MLKTRRLDVCAAEGILEALHEMPFMVCTWCGEHSMWPIRGFLADTGWALLYHCETCAGEHLEHAGMWPQVDRPPRTVTSDRTYRVGEGREEPS